MFYETVLDETERALWEAATRVEGLDHEIAVLRLRLLGQMRAAGLAGLDRADLTLLVQAVKTRHLISRSDELDCTAALAGTLAHFAASLGVEE